MRIRRPEIRAETVQDIAYTCTLILLQYNSYNNYYYAISDLLHYTISFSHTLYCSLSGDSIGNSIAQALAKDLKHCANMKELK